MTKDELLKMYSVDVNSGRLFRRNGSGGMASGSEAGWLGSHGYVYVTIARRKYRRARLIYLAHHGLWPEHNIDHIDRNRTNDSISNLRDCTTTENNRNKGLRVDNSSGCAGVSWVKRESRWVAKLGAETIGYFRTLEEAVEARVAHSGRLWGEH